MVGKYPINEIEVKDSWRLFRILGDFVDGFDKMAHVGPGVTIFGSSRIKANSPNYRRARRLGKRLAEEGFPVFTGGGPGAMAGTNQGAFEAGGQSIGLKIDLPAEASNDYLTEEVMFHYFFVRKVCLVRYSIAFILLPGGFGTLDEFFEAITLVQTQKIRPVPIILYGSDFWKGMVRWLRRSPLKEGYINSFDMSLFTITDDINEIVKTLHAARHERDLIDQQG